MTKQEAIEAIKNELSDFHNYAEDVRCDWSDFDGRDLLRRFEGFKQRVQESLSVLTK